MIKGPIEILGVVSRALDQLGIDYLVGGSFASSHYGVPRSTLDVDLVAAVERDDVSGLAQQLSGEFYVDAQLTLEAVQRGGTFNIIHRETMFKVDVFMMQRDEWSIEEMRRARTETVIGAEGPVQIRFATPEDTLLHKLVWYRLGDESSDRQWDDVRGLMMVHGPRLDDDYLDLWAPSLKVADLLARARASFGSH